MSPSPSDMRLRIDRLLDRLRRQGQEHAHTIRSVESNLAFLDDARRRHLCTDIRPLEHLCLSVLEAVVQDQHGLRPIAEVAQIVGVSAEHLHAMVRVGRLPVQTVDGARHASVADARRACGRQRPESGQVIPTAPRSDPERPPQSMAGPVMARAAIRNARAPSPRTRTA